MISKIFKKSENSSPRIISKNIFNFFKIICFTIFIREKTFFSTAPPSIDRQPRARHVPPRLKPVRVVSKDRKPKKSKESENKINKTAKGWYQLAPI